MKVSNEQMAAVVAEASKHMSDPNYSALVVGDFVAQQAPLVQYVSASESELGGAEGVIHVIFHAGLLAKAIERAGGSPPLVDFQDLDAAAHGNAAKRLAKAQPALADFIASNIEEGARRDMLNLVALALSAASGEP